MVVLIKRSPSGNGILTCSQVKATFSWVTFEVNVIKIVIVLGPYGMQPPMGMGRGYGGYGAAGFGGGPPGPAPGFGYGEYT